MRFLVKILAVSKTKDGSTLVINRTHLEIYRIAIDYTLCGIRRFARMYSLLLFFFQITRNKKVPVSAPLLFFFGTLYCSNYYSIKSKPVPVVITVVNNNIAAR